MHGTAWIAAFAAAFAFATTAGAADGDYPTRPVKVIVPFAPGGGSDFIARFMAKRLSDSLGQQFIVENRPGAGGLIGIEQGIRAPADGYTLTVIASSYTVNPAVYPIKFDPNADITPIVQMSQGPLLVVANPAFKARTLKEMVAMAKAKPGSVNFASSGQGSVIHMATELFATTAGIRMNHVPYKGTGPALTDTVAGQTDVFFSSTATALPHVKAGRLRALAVTTAKRISAEPDVPTVIEAGVPGYEVILWHGLIGPKGMPQPIVDKLNAEVVKILKLKDAADQLQADGVAPAGGTPEHFRETIGREILVWKKVAQDASVKVE